MVLSAGHSCGLCKGFRGDQQMAGEKPCPTTSRRGEFPVPAFALRRGLGVLQLASFGFVLLGFRLLLVYPELPKSSDKIASILGALIITWFGE